jgi:hypothetical protein
VPIDLQRVGILVAASSQELCAATNVSGFALSTGSISISIAIWPSTGVQLMLHLSPPSEAM